MVESGARAKLSASRTRRQHDGVDGRPNEHELVGEPDRGHAIFFGKGEACFFGGLQSIGQMADFGQDTFSREDLRFGLWRRSRLVGSFLGDRYRRARLFDNRLFG
jgi:hypothetical protein